MYRLVLTAVLVASRVSAQGAPGLVSVNGVAYDSLRSAPLAGAIVTVLGSSRTVTTDARGRFHFDSVSAGPHTFALEHDALDSIGFSGLTVKAVVAAGSPDVRIAVPSFATLWHAACGERPAPADSGFIYGTIRDAAHGTPLANANVDLTWADVSADKTKGIRQRRYHAVTQSNATGGYGICGVPTTTGSRLRASTDSGTTGLIDLPQREIRVQRLDLAVGAGIAADTTRRGTITGTVTTTTGAAVAGARVVMDEVPEVRTGNDGRFTIRGIPAGTRQLEILAIGMTPEARVVDVAANDTAIVNASLRRVTTLDAMRVNATGRQLLLARQLDDRKKGGLGTQIDSTEVAKRGTMQAVFATLPGAMVENRSRSAIGKYVVTFRAGTGRCAALIWLDGFRSSNDDLAMLRPDDIAVVEAYPERALVPFEFQVPLNPCGVIAVWTKSAMR